MRPASRLRAVKRRPLMKAILVWGEKTSKVKMKLSKRVVHTRTGVGLMPGINLTCCCPRVVEIA